MSDLERIYSNEQIMSKQEFIDQNWQRYAGLYSNGQILDEQEFIDKNWEGYLALYKFLLFGAAIIIWLVAAGLVACIGGIVGAILGSIVVVILISLRLIDVNTADAIVQLLSELLSVVVFFGILVVLFRRLSSSISSWITEWSEQSAKGKARDKYGQLLYEARDEYRQLLKEMNSLARETHCRLERFSQLVESNRVPEAYDVDRELETMFNELRDYRDRLFKDKTAFNEWYSTYDQIFRDNPELALRFEEIRHHRELEKLARERIGREEELAIEEMGAEERRHRELIKIERQKAEALKASAQYYHVIVEDEQGRVVLDWRQPVLGKLEVQGGNTIRKTDLWGRTEEYVVKPGQRIRTKLW